MPLARVKSTLGPGTMMIARDARVKPIRCDVGMLNDLAHLDARTRGLVGEVR
jgi:hypothetical protein